MEKAEIRKCVKAKKAELSRAEVEEYSHKLCEVFMQQDFYRNADVIYAYLAYNTEVCTNEIIERAWADGKTVAVPKVFESGIMEFIKIDSFDEIKEGYFGIPEPDFGEISVEENALIIFPGLAFDRQHNRIGYGGGFYDRYLDRHSDKNFLKAAIAYDFQIFDKIETEEHDKKVDLIVTRNGLI